MTPRMSTRPTLNNRLPSETDPLILEDIVAQDGPRMPPPFPRGILRHNTASAAAERARFDAELLSHKEEVKRKEASARLDLASIHAMNRSQRTRFSSVVSAKLQDMLARMERRLKDLGDSVHEIIVRAGANSLQGLEVKDLVGRISQEVDVERRAADEADLKAPEVTISRSTNHSAENHDSYKSGYIVKAKIP